MARQTRIPYFITLALLRALKGFDALSSAFVAHISLNTLASLFTDFWTKVRVLTTLWLFTGVAAVVQSHVWRTS